MPERQSEAVLTLAEAAAYLRVPEPELLRLAEQREIPAQRIGGEWRLLKRGLDHWLVYGPRIFRDYPPWFIDHPILDELLVALERRLLQRIGPEKPQRGSKKSVREAIGVFKNNSDRDEVLANLAAIRIGAAQGAEE